MKSVSFLLALVLLAGGVMLVWMGRGTDAGPIAAPTPSGSSVAEVDPDYVPPEPGEFEFTDQLNETLTSQELEGRVWLGSFFFSTCPSLCVDQNAALARLQQRFQSDRFRMIAISVDPKHDDPSTLWQYANRFKADHQRWKFLTGQTIEYINRVGRDYFQLTAADKEHTADVAVFGPDGTKHGLYNVLKPVEFAKLVKKVEGLLGEEGKAPEAEQPVAEPQEAAEDAKAEPSAA